MFQAQVARGDSLASKPKVGLLGLYLDLYDRAVPDIRPRIDGFYATIAGELAEHGLEVVTAPVCRLAPEFEAAVKSFERADAEAIITLHLAYSPSLESCDGLAHTKLPLIVLDTSPALEYGPEQDPAELMFNHGIHGVQDLCNLLLRKGKAFQIEAGHWRHSDVLDRVAAWARAARLAARMQRARVGRIGKPFVGMGDFAVPDAVLRDTIGIETVTADASDLHGRVPAPDDEEVEAEVAEDATRFELSEVTPAAHRRAVRAGLAVRHWLRHHDLSAFTFNFLSIDRACGLPTVPFLEASKAMAAGIGYAGEGDVLTAALVGALASVHPQTTFTEMFCPDWAGERILVSHMGEMNVDLCAAQPRLREMPFPWTDAENPVFAVGRFREGRAVLVNLAPVSEDAYTLIVAPCTVLEVEGEDRHADLIHGWFRPEMPVADFLAAFSRAGGTHHSALVYGDVASEVAKFGRLMGWNVVVLGGAGA